MITVPDLIWSGVVGALAGAFMALMTTLLNNRGQNSRQAQQLKHDIDQRTRQLQHDIDQRKAQFAYDSEQRRIDREMSLRREVYLEAAAATGKMQEFISSYARQDVAESDKLATIQGSTAAINKIHIVGSNRTIEAFSNAQLAFAKCNGRLGIIKLDIVKKTIDIDQLQRALHLLEERRQGLLRMAQEFGPNTHPETVEAVRSRVLAIDREIEEKSDDLDKAQDDLFKFQMKLIKESLKSNLDMLQAFSKAALAVREELRLDLDAEAYQAFIETHQKQIEQELSGLIEHVSEKADGE